MRLQTIWTMRAMSINERFRRTSEWFCLKIASHIPRSIRYWVVIVETSRFAADHPTVEAPTIHAFDLLDHMSK